MTAQQIKDFGFGLLGIPIEESVVDMVQLMISNGHTHVQLSRIYGKTTAATIAQAILKDKWERNEPDDI